jgi:hypothetical protein
MKVMGINFNENPVLQVIIPHLPSMNEMLGEANKHRSKGAELIRTLRAEGKSEGVNWLNSKGGRKLRPCVIHFMVFRSEKNSRRRDIHNLLIKPLIDGMFVDSGILPDDSEEWIPAVILEYAGKINGEESVLIHAYETIEAPVVGADQGA